MNWTIYGMECVGALILFTCLIMISLCKNPVWWIHDYPKDIQEKYFETHERIPTEVLSAPVFLKKGFAVLLALSILRPASCTHTVYGCWWTGTTAFSWTGCCLPTSSASVCRERSTWTRRITRRSIM